MISFRTATKSVINGIALTIFLVGATRAWSQETARPVPTHKNVQYAKHKSTVLDFYQAKSDKPTPLAIYVHGGGFRGGSKNGVNRGQLRGLLQAGISVAAVEYRFVPGVPLSICFDDVTRAIQFLRSKSKEWNVDKKRVAAWGGSAGAQLVMYLAFQDDLAKPKSDDPIERESTRLVCVATNGGQVTMDFEWWVKHVPDYKAGEGAHVRFGLKSEEEFNKIVKRIAALDLVSKDDPPLWMSYRMGPKDAAPKEARQVRGWQIHHVVHGIKLKEKMDQLGLECHLVHPGSKNKYSGIVPFFREKLTNLK